MNAPPPRLLDDSAAAAALRDDLARAERSPVQAYDRDRGLARLRAAIAVGAVGDGGEQATSGSADAGSAATIAKWVGLAALVGGVVIGGGLALRDRPASAPVATPAAPVAAPAAPVQTAPPAARIEAPVVAAPEPAVVEPAPSEDPVDAITPTAHRKSRVERSAPDPDEALRRETAHLAELRRLSVRDPGSALTLAERGHREFAHGMFREEREAIAIFALDELGRAQAARRRATAFLERYPHGPFSERMRESVLSASPP